MDRSENIAKNMNKLATDSIKHIKVSYIDKSD